MKPLHNCLESVWQSVCSHVKHGVVFIDNSCAESLHWNGGLPLLVNSGASDVKEFSPFESAKESEKKGVFIVSSLLFDETADVIQDVIKASSFQYVIVITSVSPNLHLYAKTGATEGSSAAVFEQFEDKLLQCMGNMNFTAEVFHIPMCVANPVPGVFLLPAFNSLFPLLQSDVKRLELQYNSHRSTKGERVSFDSLEDVDMSCLPLDLKLTYKRLVSSVNDLLSNLAVREEIYCLGQTSRILAVELENNLSAKQQRKTTQETASVLFVDRTLDLVSVTGHHGDTLLDKILGVLPRREDSNDVLVNMVSLCASSNSDGTTVCNGCLAQNRQSTTRSVLTKMASSKQKESIMELNRQLVDAASKEKLPLKLTGKPGRVTSDQLLSTVKLFRNNNFAIDNHCELLQLSIAAAETLSHPENGCYDKLMGVEKLLLQQLSEEDTPSALCYITELLETEMKTPSLERKVTLDHVLLLFIYYYSLCGDDYDTTEDDENAAKLALVNAILQEKGSLSGTIQELVGETVNRSVVIAIVDDLWYKLEAIGLSRSHLKSFRSLVEPASPVSPPSYKPLVSQISEIIFNPDKPDLVDIQYKSSGFKDMLKTGFGFFMNVRKPRPSDHPLLVIFVVGGVNTSEVKHITEVIASHKTNLQVLIGSNRLVNPGDVLQRALCQDNIQLQQP